jgi:hypothetical protein
METCSFSDFMQMLKPWLNRDYVRKAYLDADGNFRLMFVDGGENAYRIDDCTQAQLADALRLLQENNIPVEKDTAGSG